MSNFHFWNITFKFQLNKIFKKASTKVPFWVNYLSLEVLTIKSRDRSNSKTQNSVFEKKHLCNINKFLAMLRI